MDSKFLYHHIRSVKKKLILFDFDGTITTKDTFLEFIKFYRGSFQFLLGFSFLSPVLMLHLINFVQNWRAKEYVLGWFFKNEKLVHFNKMGERFCDEIVSSLVRPEAVAAIRDYQLQGHEVVVISASAENWVKPWCTKLGLHCIATKLEVQDEKITGKIQGKNCYGEEKVNRLKKEYNLAAYETIVAYGDSSGDRELLAIANEKFYKPFREKVI